LSEDFPLCTKNFPRLYLEVRGVLTYLKNQSVISGISAEIVSDIILR